MPNYVYYLDHQNKNITSIKSPFESSALHASLSFWYGDIKLVMQIIHVVWHMLIGCCTIIELEVVLHKS